MRSLLSGPRPDLTPAHLGGFLLAGIPVLAALANVFGFFHLSKDQQDALKHAVEWGVIGGGSLIFGDTGLRIGRNHADATKVAAQAQADADVQVAATHAAAPGAPATARTRRTK